MPCSASWLAAFVLFLAPLMLVGRAGRTSPLASGRSIASAFSQGTDDWEVADGVAALSWESSGHLTAVSATTEPWYWSAPGKFLGDRSEALGGTLLFELRDSLRRGPRETGAAVVLEGGGLRLGHWRPHEERGEAWDLFSVDLTPGGWEDLETGQRVGTTELEHVLASLERLLIRGIRHRGAAWGELRRAVLLPGAGAQGDISIAAVVPKVTVGPASLNFGDVALGDFGTMPVTIRNVGSTPTTVSWTFDQPDLPHFSYVYTGSGTELPPNQSVQVQIAFAPRSAGKRNARFLVTAAGRPRPLAVKLKGRGFHPLFVTPVNKNFGKVKLGTEASAQFNIRNLVNDEAIRITTALEGDAASQFGYTPVEDTVPAGGSYTTTVKFRPTRKGKHQIQLVVHIPDDPEKLPIPPTSVTIRGEGTAGPPRLEVEPSPLNFGEVLVGHAGQASLTLRNFGGDPLSVTLPATLPAPFHWVDAPQGPLTIPPLDETEIAIDYIPTATGSHSASLGIDSNDPARRRVTVQLQGQSPAGDPIRFEPATIQMDNQPPGGLQEKVLRIVNVSNKPVSLLVLVPLPTSKFEAEWSRSYPPEGESLGVGETLEVTVYFHPVELGDRSTTMTVREFRPGRTVEYVIPFHGTCVVPPKKGSSRLQRKPPARAPAARSRRVPGGR